MNSKVMTAETEVIVSRDARVAQHEAGHLTVGRALGAKFGGATIIEDLDAGYGGLCWGPEFVSHFEAGETTSGPVIGQISSLMPGDGDARDDDVTLIYAHVHNRVVELTAGSEAERMQFGNSWPATDDRKQEKALAALIYSSSEAQDMFISACAAEARAILRRHADVVDALTAALIQHRSINSDLIEATISRTVAARQLAQEYERRRLWREVQARADKFNELCRE
jgi:hypothetical protein